jgi:glyoxylase-like metal-dependent hydrolase (beta-lactamase superfamily II)
MKKLSVLMSCLCLFTMALVQTAKAQQSKSLAEQSYTRAREVLEAGIKAMGGMEGVRAVSDVTRELSGARSDQGQGMQPVPLSQINQPPITNPFRRFTSMRDLRGQRAIEIREAAIFGGQPLKFKTVVGPAGVFSLNEVSKTMRLSPPTAMTSITAGVFRRHPESLLPTALNRPEGLRWLGETDYEGRKQRVVSFADADGTLVALYFDAQTNLLTKSETLADDPVLGDVTVEVIYSDWRPAGKLLLPYRYVDKVGGSVLQDTKVTSIAFDTKPADSLFAMPEGYAKLEPSPPAPVVKKISDNLYALLGSYNSLLVVFKDYALVVEAGASTRFAQATIAEIKKIVADKPIRYLVSTHFHFDHISGVRSYIAEGVTIVTTQGAKSVIERMASASHAMRPDALSRGARTPVIETFTGKRVFDDGTTRLELYEFANPHCGEIIVAYLPKEKLLFEADMLDLDIPEGGTSAAGEDTADLAAKIQQLGLQVETIIPVHGRIGTIDELRRALAARTTATK